ncbi:hypothetical protein DAEQUDRAFT_81674 [Daedalea quercina L-15889]|uniref:Uncharacterized protein n=1 Tax=Daedalea quercina L-15889 TaxID=1314783 RepID=A0A165SH89_9APHY|nr:hypothetical protein DAEQUDRAFT_81674 [Daedalea quercina L-15889]
MKTHIHDRPYQHPGVFYPVPKWELFPGCTSVLERVGNVCVCSDRRATIAARRSPVFGIRILLNLANKLNLAVFFVRRCLLRLPFICFSSLALVRSAGGSPVFVNMPLRSMNFARAAIYFSVRLGRSTCLLTARRMYREGSESYHRQSWKTGMESRATRADCPQGVRPTGSCSLWPPPAVRNRQ